MPYQWTDEAGRQARSKLAAIEAGHILVSQTCAAWLCGVTPQAIANRAASPLYVIDGRKRRDLLGHKTTAMTDRYVRSVGSPVADAREAVGSRDGGRDGQGG